MKHKNREILKYIIIVLFLIVTVSLWLMSYIAIAEGHSAMTIAIISALLFSMMPVAIFLGAEL